MSEKIAFPEKGTSASEVLDVMRAARDQDADWRGGKTFSLVYNAGEELRQFLKDAYTLFFSENGLSPIAFPSLRRFEAEVLSMTASLFHGEEARGNLTSGGTESILMAIKTARDYARAKKNITAPELLLPQSAHPAFEKAAHYFGVKPVHIPLGPDFRADVNAARELVTENTVLIVGSAPGYPHGVIDPIADLAALAMEHDTLCHVDACLGGFLLPFVKKLGYPIPDFDFAVPGVTSISADLHKYGFAARGASIIMYRNMELRNYQYFAYPDWPGGLYGSPTMTGSRPGGAIAAAWAIIKHLGEEGYLRLAKIIMDTTTRFLEGIRNTPGLRILGEPQMSVFAFTSDTINIYELGDAMSARGWHLDRQQMPPALHLMLSPAHEAVADLFVEDLRACTKSLAAGEPAPEGSAAMYGMLGTIPERSTVNDFILEFMNSLY